MRSKSPFSWIEQFLLRAAIARVALLFVFHILVFATCYVAATVVRYEFAVPAAYFPTLKGSLAIVVTVQTIAGLLFGFYRGWWRYVGIADVIRLVVGLSSAMATLGLMWYVFHSLDLNLAFAASSRGVLLIDFAFVLLTLFAARLAMRVGRDRFRPLSVPMQAKRVVIIGAGDAGETLAREIEHRPQLGMRVAAFVDDHRAKWGSLIRGVTVSGPIENIADIADQVRATEALIAIPSASGKRLREIVQYLAEAGLSFKTIPGIDHLVSGKVHVTQLRPVNLEDLLRREQVVLPGDRVRDLFRGKRVIVTGAGGTIGSELASQILQFEPDRLVLAERSEFALYEVHKRLSREAPWLASLVRNAMVDIQQPLALKQLLQAERPDIVVHAAAHKHVPLGEENPAEYVRNNTLATKALAEACEQMNVSRFVLISTDKAINPTSVMGASKRAAEILLLDVARRSSTMKAMVVRFGNVLGSSGSVVPLFVEQIAAGGPVTVTHPEVTRYFLRTSEAVSLVLQAAILGDDGEVFMLDMGEPVKIVDLARDLIRLSNFTEEEIPIVFTGLRPGEKLFEEVRLHAESMKVTVHPQIVVTAACQPDARVVDRWTSRMRLACELESGDPVALLRELIPEYAPAVHEPLRTIVTPTIPIRRRGEDVPSALPVVKETPIASTT